MKQLENSKETHEVFTGNTDSNTSAVSGALITIKVKWYPMYKRHLTLGKDRQDTFLAPYIPGPHSI
jgi:hypothetical protein